MVTVGLVRQIKEASYWSLHIADISLAYFDLKQAQDKDIDKCYFDQLIQLKVELILIAWLSITLKFPILWLNLKLMRQTSEMANKDLDSYYNALDKWAACTFVLFLFCLLHCGINIRLGYCIFLITSLYFLYIAYWYLIVHLMLFLFV